MDDATGIVANALFCKLKKTRSHFQLLEALIGHCGLPLALYSDRHAALKYTPSSDSADAPTQFSRAMDELGIQLIFARSPQAKGRVERTTRTFQDRLVTELRLVGTFTIDDANQVLEDFLPRFNSRFMVPAQESEAVYRPVDDGIRLEKVLCFKYRRRVARDNTVRYRWRTLQLLPGTDRTSYAGTVVDVLERLDGHLEVQHQGRDIPSQEAPPHPSVLRGLARRTAHTVAPYLSSKVNDNGLGGRSVTRLATPDQVHHVGKLIAVAGPNGTRRVRKPVSSPLVAFMLDVEYVRILHLAATTMEIEVDRALGRLLESGLRFDYAMVRELVAPAPPSVPELKLPGKVDLGVYDRLLVGGAR